MIKKQRQIQVVRIYLLMSLSRGYSSTIFDSLLGYQDIKIVKGGDIEVKILYLLKEHSIAFIYDIMNYVV